MFSFLSIEFVIFFTIFFCIYWLFRSRPNIQNIILCIASYFIIYLMVGLMPTSILFIFSSVMYVLVYLMNKYVEYKKILLIFGMLITLVQLSFFKYYDFFRDNITTLMQLLGLDSSNLAANIIFPLGISYYSFQAISYLVSRYRNEKEVIHFSYIQLLTHFSFFATITAGPISRAQSMRGLTDIDGNPCGMSKQICTSTQRHILYPSLALMLIAIALIKKWWIAGWLAENWVDPIFANPLQYHSLEILAAIYGYTLQLYLDFSGYSEMMIAFGLLLGFRIPINFRAPLIAHNIRDFWNRWHISLSTWIRDYIYIPLGGNQASFFRIQCNLLIAFVLSGVWHGSGWNFFLWGLLHGAALVLLNLTDKLYQAFFKVSAQESRSRLYQSGIFGKIVGVFLTVHFVCFCFVFFRARTFEEAVHVFQALCNNYTNIAWQSNPLYLLTVLLVVWIIYPFIYKLGAVLRQQYSRIPIYVSIIPLFIILIIISVFAPSGIPGFIYANF